MADEGTRVTIRMSPEEIQLMEDFMDLNQVGNRSDFIRDAISKYITQKKAPAVVDSENGVFVHLTGMQLKIMDLMKEDGTIYDNESYIRSLLLNDLIPAESKESSKLCAVRAVQGSAKK